VIVDCVATGAVIGLALFLDKLIMDTYMTDTMWYLVLLVLCCHQVLADFTCMCNYEVEKEVYPKVKQYFPIWYIRLYNIVLRSYKHLHTWLCCHLNSNWHFYQLVLILNP